MRPGRARMAGNGRQPIQGMINQARPAAISAPKAQNASRYTRWRPRLLAREMLCEDRIVQWQRAAHAEAGEGPQQGQSGEVGGEGREQAEAGVDERRKDESQLPPDAIGERPPEPGPGQHPAGRWQCLTGPPGPWSAPTAVGWQAGPRRSAAPPSRQPPIRPHRWLSVYIESDRGPPDRWLPKGSGSLWRLWP
jgi:hypothetical protein